MQKVRVIFSTDLLAQQVTVRLRAAAAALASMKVKEGVGDSDDFFLAGCCDGSGITMDLCGSGGEGQSCGPQTSTL